MKKRNENTLFFLLLITAAFLFPESCRERYPVVLDTAEKEQFFYSETEGIYSEGEPLFLFDESLHQQSCNPKRLQYRFQTDIQDSCLNVIMETKPKTTGVHITTHIELIGGGKSVTNISVMECSKIMDDKYWLWDSYTATGVIIRLF